MSKRRQNKVAQLGLSLVAGSLAVIAMVLANQADRFGNATHIPAASVCGIFAVLAVCAIFILKTSIWLDE